MASIVYRDTLIPAGKHVGRYRFCKLLESREHVSVYLGYDMRLGRAVAIKVVHNADADEARSQLFNEKKLLAALVQHPHIVSILDFVESSSFVFLVTEFANCGSLRDCLNARTRLPVEKRIQYITQAAEALQYMHDNGYVHRDVKPENLLLTSQDSILLCDLGIAVPVRNDDRRENSMGTAAYVSPEQIEGYPSPKSDQYSLAIVAYELMCGMPPFSGSVPHLVWKQMVSDPPFPSFRSKKLPHAVEEILRQALAKDSTQRFACIKTFALELGKALCSPSALLPETDEMECMPKAQKATGTVQEHVTDHEPHYPHTQLQGTKLPDTSDLQ